MTWTLNQIRAVVDGGLWDRVAIFITWDSRVPCLVVGPYAKPGHLSRQLNSHVSLMRFCENVFGLDAITDRDAASHDMTDCIDLSQPPNPHP